MKEFKKIFKKSKWYRDIETVLHGACNTVFINGNNNIRSVKKIT